MTRSAERGSHRDRCTSHPICEAERFEARDDDSEMELAISLDLAIGLNAGHPQRVQLCLTLVRCEIGREMARVASSVTVTEGRTGDHGSG